MGIHIVMGIYITQAKCWEEGSVRFYQLIQILTVGSDEESNLYQPDSSWDVDSHNSTKNKETVWSNKPGIHEPAEKGSLTTY